MNYVWLSVRLAVGMGAALLAGCSQNQIDPLHNARQEDPAAVRPVARRVAAELSALTAAGATPFDRGASAPERPAEPRNATGGETAGLQREGVPFPSVRFVILSDFHHLSSRLWEPGAAFARWLSTNDGKVLARSDELLSATERTVAAEHAAAPLDFVVITGDLTANGSVRGHEDMAALSARIEDLGVPVFVIPGNHDVNNPWAAELTGERATRVPTVSRERFMKLYQEAGYGEAVSHGPDDLSYRIDLDNDLTLFLLDTVMWRDNQEIGVPRSTGEIGSRQRRWLQDELAAMRRAGRTPLVFMHHNLLDHGPHRGYGSRRYVIDEGPRFERLFQENAVPVVFSGHIHARNHTGSVDADEAWLYELAGGAISLYPHEYRVVTIDGERQELTMEPRRLHGFSDPAFREWSMATYISDFAPDYANRLQRELAAASPMEEIGARDLVAMATYLALWRLQHRDGVDRPGLPEQAVQQAATLQRGRDLWNGVAPEYYARWQRGYGSDPAPSDGAITIDLERGWWWPAE